MRPHLSIVIVSYNVQVFLLQCLRSIFKNRGELDIEVIVVDNHSTDNTVAEVRAGFQQVRLLENQTNVGFSKACNQAIVLATAPYILLLNPDTEIEEAGFERMIAFMNQQPHCGALGPRLLNTDRSFQGSARRFPNFWTAFFGRSSALTRLFPGNRISLANVPALQPDLIEPVEVDWVSGAAMMIRQETLKQVGFLDENFFLFWEDADWCYRMKTLGWKVFYYPKISIVHHIGRSVASRRFRSVIEFHRSAYLWYRKHKINGPWSVRNLIAILGLNTRTLFQLLRIGFTSTDGRSHS